MKLLSWRRIPLVLALLLQASGAKANTWEECKVRVQQIIDGTLIYKSITSENISQYLYQGYVPGLPPSFPRSRFLTVSLKGCRILCNNPIVPWEPPKALGIAATWVFPLAILFNLPWESLHQRKVSKTLVAALNWLGSPQTALTATIFNFGEIRNCHRRVRSVGLNNLMSPHLSNALYVLSAFNQFDGLDTSTLTQKGEQPDKIQPTRMLQVLIYGLFRPLSPGEDPSARHSRALLCNLAYQLRMLRCRSVIPTLASLGIFLVAFIFSVVLAFAELGGHTPFPLSLGLLVSWLPLLVVFTIVDRNPNSADRSAELMSRWLFNVNAVMNWVKAGRPTLKQHITSERISDSEIRRTIDEIRWWRPQVEVQVVKQQQEEPVQLQNQHELQELGNAQRNQRTPHDDQEQFHIGDFIGQGRKMQYCGLVHAVLTATEGAKFDELVALDLENYAQETAVVLKRGKPGSWRAVAVLSFVLVWCEIMMAFMVSFCTPTIGLGCRALGSLLFGLLSSISWFAQFWTGPSRLIRWICHFFNCLAIISLIAIIGAMLTGVMNNCYCKSSALSMPFLGGYMDFENSKYYRDNFNSARYWAAAAVIGGVIPLVAFGVALFWWVNCKHLWSADERDGGWLGHEETDIVWLQ